MSVLAYPGIVSKMEWETPHTHGKELIASVGEAKVSGGHDVTGAGVVLVQPAE